MANFSLRRCLSDLSKQKVFYSESTGNWSSTSIWKQEWHSSEALELDAIWEQDWRNYISTLQKAHIHLSENRDELAWSFPQSGGSYLTKLAIP
jgi:hypothetical protein